MATIVSQHGRHHGRYILRKTAANFTEINRKHLSTASIRNIIKNRVNVVAAASCKMLWHLKYSSRHVSGSLAKTGLAN